MNKVNYFFIFALFCVCVTIYSIAVYINDKMMEDANSKKRVIASVTPVGRVNEIDLDQSKDTSNFNINSFAKQPFPSVKPTEPLVVKAENPEPTQSPSPTAVPLSLLSRGKNIFADSFAGRETNPACAVDGSASTKWFADGPGMHWIYIDLGKEYTIERWVVYHAEAGGETPYFNTRDFKLQIPNAQQWVDVDVVIGNTQKITDRNIKPVKTQFVGLLITNPTNENQLKGARIYEFAVYGR